MLELTKERLINYTIKALNTCRSRMGVICFIVYECPTDNYIKNIMDTKEHTSFYDNYGHRLPEDEINCIKKDMVDKYTKSPRYDNGGREGTTMFFTTCMLTPEQIGINHIKDIIEKGKNKIDQTSFIYFDTDVNFLKNEFGKRVLGELYDDVMTMYNNGVKEEYEYSEDYKQGIDDTVKWIYQNCALDEPFPEKQLKEELLNNKRSC